jgi:DHA2 family multidrug resistance protein
MLAGWRVVQGIGGGALLSTAQSTLFEAFPPAEVAIGQAMFGIGVMVGPTIGPTSGGWITDNYNWPWIFYINVPLGIIAFFMVTPYVRASAHQPRARTIDGTGIVLLALCSAHSSGCSSAANATTGSSRASSWRSRSRRSSRASCSSGAS